MRNDFSNQTKAILAKRVGFRCSNPHCRQLTSGPHTEPTGSINIGVAAHITAASPGGPRYDVYISAEKRKSQDNGIWLCEKCAKLVDSDEVRYTVGKLREWKRIAEAETLKQIESRPVYPQQFEETPFEKLETLIPDLLAEMRDDLARYPFEREFVLLKKDWRYQGHGLAYYYDEHPDLRNKIHILENYGLVEETTYTNVARFIITEDLVDYLLASD
jgi:hypothetical protein